MDNTTYRNKPFSEFNNFYIIYYQGYTKDAFKDWLMGTRSISFQGPYRSMDYAKKECNKNPERCYYLS